MKGSPAKLKIIHKNLSDFNILEWIPIIIRLIFVVVALACNLAVRKILCPLITFWHVKRYIESVVNLISMKFILIMLGFLKFECDGFRFFSRQSSKITLKSGFIGIGTHNSIIDYIYYSYLLNPVFVKMLIFKKQDKQQILYCPLSFIQSIRCAIDNRGFDPIVIHNEKELKKIKYRKLNMKTLISECFEQLNGPVFIMLPGLKSDEHVSMNLQVSYDIYDNEIKFQRSLVGFFVRLDERLKLNEQTYKNQIFFLMDMMHRCCSYSMYISAIEFRRMKFRYDRVTYSTFIDKYYQDNELTLRQLSYEAYAMQIDQQQKRSTIKKRQQDSEQKQQ